MSSLPAPCQGSYVDFRAHVKEELSRVVEQVGAAGCVIEIVCVCTLTGGGRGDRKYPLFS